ncbi:enoyl-CoA hydratase/isomerase family protein [Metarhizium rileyi]|uniref:Enoyl-CoA hydratase/isomerase family protein n=1 Tax=Metarhizium rileyi (strain RCEF 4871) TaxID=1649241 RepID=A0A162J369_METRR|nr:enoyl-CoA hydratase/isomerase family protein [Metarhizium rileyi RCEF 4871]
MSTSGLARSSHVTCQCVRFVTFKRPEKQNARSWQLLDEFLAELKRASADPAVKAIVISGNGTFFSDIAGLDLVDARNLSMRRRQWTSGEETSPQPMSSGRLHRTCRPAPSLRQDFVIGSSSADSKWPG